MGYDLSIIIFPNESDKSFEKIENLYRSNALKGYDSLQKIRSSEKIYDIRKVKYYYIPDYCYFCIYDIDTCDVGEGARLISKEMNTVIVTLQIYDSDVLEIHAYKHGESICDIKKDNKEYVITGDYSFLLKDRNELWSIFESDYTFIEDCAKLVFPETVVFPQKRIAKQRIVKYEKEIVLFQEKDKVPVFVVNSYNSVIYAKNKLEYFTFDILNLGKLSKGLTLIVKGEPIAKEKIVITKVAARLHEDKYETFIEKNEYDKKLIDNEMYLIFRFDDLEFPAGYNTEQIDMLRMKSVSMYDLSLYYRYKSAISFYIFYSIIHPTGTIEVIACPDENILKGGCGRTVKIE